ARRGGTVSDAEFLAPLRPLPAKLVAYSVADRGMGLTAKIKFRICVCKVVPDEDYSAAMQKDVTKLLVEVAHWLADRSSALLTIKAQGLCPRFILNADINSDQLDLKFPPEFLAAAGMAGLSVEIITNE